MNKTTQPIKIVTLTLLLSSCLLSTVAMAQVQCIFDDVIIDYGFEMGRVSNCTQQSKNKFIIAVEPEHKPINKSAWYAFSVSASKTKNIEILVYYRWHQHRYNPKISTDKVNWTVINSSQYSLLHNDKILKLQLKVSPTPQFIAAQEIIDNSYYQKWLAKYKKQDQYQVTDIGVSKGGRKITELRSTTDTKNWLLVVGRQHPPEVTGALALFHFMEQVLANTEVAIAFRKKYNILLVPNLNPDGVANGNWRYNLNNVDLNRDWGIYNQPEIKLVGDAIAEIYNSGHRLILGLDFHSTNKDVFYTQPDNETTILPLFTKQWLGQIQQRLPKYTVLRSPSHNPGLATFKTALATIHDMPSITYEIGDDTDRDLIKQTSIVAAEEMMAILNATDL